MKLPSYIIILCLLSPIAVLAQPEQTLNLKDAQQSLIQRSPFLPEGFTEGAARPAMQPTMPPQFELHGVIQLNGMWQFSLYDPKTKASKWVSQDDAHSAIKVVSYDPVRTTVIISENGNVQELTLKKPEALANTGLFASLLNPPEEPETHSPSSESSSSKEKFLELLKNKKALEERFKNAGKARQRPLEPDEEEFDDLNE